MPYILKKFREQIDNLVYEFQKVLGDRAITGNLNYFLFKLAKRECSSYSDYQEFIGELEAAKLEIYRRLVTPYEDLKIEKNGDVV